MRTGILAEAGLPRLGVGLRDWRSARTGRSEYKFESCPTRWVV
ncbi:MAG: hypothetical protein NTX87_07990 [Planctomycetota bacterium]|nr:hypothetical protein [Planctomycetota bacterium]